MEKSKLKNLESKETLERYNTYAFGILHKLKDEFSKLYTRFPDISMELNSMIVSNLNSNSLISMSDINEFAQEKSIEDLMNENGSRGEGRGTDIPMFLSIKSMH